MSHDTNASGTIAQYEWSQASSHGYFIFHTNIHVFISIHSVFHSQNCIRSSFVQGVIRTILVLFRIIYHWPAIIVESSINELSRACSNRKSDSILYKISNVDANSFEKRKWTFRSQLALDFWANFPFVSRRFVLRTRSNLGISTESLTLLSVFSYVWFRSMRKCTAGRKLRHRWHSEHKHHTSRAKITNPYDFWADSKG